MNTRYDRRPGVRRASSRISSSNARRVKLRRMPVPIDSGGAASIRKGNDLSTVGDVPRVSQIAGGPGEQLVEPVFWVRLNRADRDPFPTQARRGHRYEQAFHRRLSCSEVREAGVDDVPTGDPQLGEAGRTESRSDPAERCGAARHGLPGPRPQPCRASPTAGTTVLPELFPDCLRQLHSDIICLWGKHGDNSARPP